MTGRDWLRLAPPPPMGGYAVKTWIAVICILALASLIAALMLGLAACAKDADETTRKLDDAEQEAYLRRWSQAHGKRQKK